MAEYNTNEPLETSKGIADYVNRNVAAYNPAQNVDYTRGGANPLNDKSFKRTQQLSRIADIINNRMHVMPGSVGTWTPGQGANVGSISQVGQYDGIETEEMRQMERNRMLDQLNSQAGQNLQYRYKNMPATALEAGTAQSQQLNYAKLQDRLMRGLGLEKAKQVMDTVQRNPVLGQAFALIMGLEAPSMQDIARGDVLSNTLRRYKKLYPNMSDRELYNLLLNTQSDLTNMDIANLRGTMNTNFTLSQKSQQKKAAQQSAKNSQYGSIAETEGMKADEKARQTENKEAKKRAAFSEKTKSKYRS